MVHSCFLHGWRELPGHPPPPSGGHKHAGKTLHVRRFSPTLIPRSRLGSGKLTAWHRGISDEGPSPEQQPQPPAWQDPAPRSRTGPPVPLGPELHPPARVIPPPPRTFSTENQPSLCLLSSGRVAPYSVQLRLRSPNSAIFHFQPH